MMLCPSFDKKKRPITLEEFVPSSSPPPIPARMKPWYRYRGEEFYDVGGFNYEKMWPIVRNELNARAQWRTWRTFPCKKIAQVLPPSFSSWNEFLDRGGVLDKSTGKGTLTEAQKKVFWSDQCECKCWKIEEKESVQEEERKISMNMQDYSETLKRLNKCGAIPRSNRIEKTILRIQDCGVIVSSFDTIDSARRSLEKQKEDEKRMIKVIDDFWNDLEVQYRASNPEPKDGYDMIRWYWSFPLKQEFMRLYSVDV